MSLLIRQSLRLMTHAPHGIEWSRVALEPRDHVLVNLRQLIPEQSVIDLHRAEDRRERPGHIRHLLDELVALIPAQLEEFCGMPLKRQYCPPWEELVLMQVCDGEWVLCEAMISEGPPSLTSLTVESLHDLDALPGPWAHGRGVEPEQYRA